MQFYIVIGNCTAILLNYQVPIKGKVDQIAQ